MMRIRVLGGGWYGCHISAALLAAGHDVELHETAATLFAGASGSNPARCHLGFHYPRSFETRTACLIHQVDFMGVYGHLTRGVPVNVYAVAAESSLVDFGTYLHVLRGQADFIVIRKPEEFGLRDVEGAVLTGERHVIIDKVRTHFETLLGDRVVFGQTTANVDDPWWDLTIDCTFSALDGERIDRYEPCLTVLLEGEADRAVTIMDGPFPSIYPWDESRKLSSLTSALHTPLTKDCKRYEMAQSIIRNTPAREIEIRGELMFEQICRFWPEARDRYRIVDHRLAIRAMPKSAADTRLCDVVPAGERSFRVRAGKIDAIFHAERVINGIIRDGKQYAKHMHMVA
jgi:hypothetical protein